MEFLLVFFAALGILAIGWALFGLLLLPVFGKNMLTLTFENGDGAALEQKVRAFGWLRDGEKPGAELLIVDCGLTERVIKTAHMLSDRYPWVGLCPGPALRDYIELRQDTI